MTGTSYLASFLVFGREVTDPGLRLAGTFVLVFFLVSIVAVVLSHLFVNQDKVAEEGEDFGVWINRLFPVQVMRPFRVLKPLGKRLRCYGWGGVGISILLFAVIWNLAE